MHQIVVVVPSPLNGVLRTQGAVAAVFLEGHLDVGCGPSSGAPDVRSVPFRRPPDAVLRFLWEQGLQWTETAPREVDMEALTCPKLSIQ